MGVKAFTKAAVSDLKGKLQRGPASQFKIFEKLTTVRAAKRILDDRPVCADSALRKLCKSIRLGVLQRRFLWKACRRVRCPSRRNSVVRMHCCVDILPRRP